jgi:hypothetical protein
MINSIDNGLPKPKCPFCKAEVDLQTVLKQKEGVGFLKQEILYYCPGCQAVLGFSRGKFTG